MGMCDRCPNKKAGNYQAECSTGLCSGRRAKLEEMLKNIEARCNNGNCDSDNGAWCLTCDGAKNKAILKEVLGQ